MRRTIATLALAAVVLSGAPPFAAPAGAQATDAVPYQLGGPPSDFEWGCFGACDCATFVRSPLTGTFSLRLAAVDPLFTYYDVLDVRFKFPGDPDAVLVTGTGVYRRGGEVAIEDQLILDLSFGGAPSQHFDSGLGTPGATFPAIARRVSLHGEVCHDSVLVIDAKPTSTSSVDGGVPSLSLVPNPFDVTTRFTFTLPRDAVVDLGVFDVTGRRLRSLAAREPMTAGTHVRAWDGRLETGTVVAPGLYLVRLDTPWGRTTRAVAKLR